MPRYLLTGKDHRGRTRTEAVAAATADEAAARFRDRGFTDVVLHSDEVVGHLFDPKILKNLTPQECLAVGRISRPAFLARLVFKLYRTQWWVFAIVVALLVGRRVLGSPWGLVDTVATAYLFSPPLIVLLAEVFNPGRKFERVMTYNAWARWPEMLAALEPIRRYLPEAQYAFYRAKALAGLGRLDEALEEVRPYADDPKLPVWLYWGQLGEVFEVAHLPDRVVECLEKAESHAPDNVTVLVDLAMVLLRYRRDVGRARSLLDRIRSHEISDMMLPFVRFAEGMLALEERQPGRARPLLEDALAQAEKFRHTTALMGGAIDRIRTYLALACAGTGDTTAAEMHFRHAEPRLLAFRATDLLDRCRSALGHTAARE